MPVGGIFKRRIGNRQAIVIVGLTERNSRRLRGVSNGFVSPGHYLFVVR